MLNKLLKKKVVVLGMCILTVISLSTSVFASTISYTSSPAIPSAVQTNLNNAYYNYYNPLDGGTDHISLSTFQAACTAFSTKSSPSWSSTSDWYYSGLGGVSEYINNATYLSKIARTIYSENTNVTPYATRQDAMWATADIIRNRTNWDINHSNTFFGGYNLDGVADSSQFACTTDGNIGFTNPLYYNSSSTEMQAWAYSIFLANHLGSSDEPLGTILPSSDYYYCFDMSTGGIPFYTSSYTQCTSSNVTSAAYYKYGSTYYPITRNVVKYGSILFYSWKDGVTFK